ncbi:hypothetical protein H1W37_08865 [Stappia taiwanensis]|uniref:Uncharacterized protein n=1 Tax=Stappia taiwanensis TaxID=992267 RepID=A0A838XK98_9HYPH|nr:hypothetical protein [Stappia taiwanensis]MBA4611759.1 hypothetical protein [Stappia taiwanensis]
MRTRNRSRARLELRCAGLSVPVIGFLYGTNLKLVPLLGRNFSKGKPGFFAKKFRILGKGRSFRQKAGLRKAAHAGQGFISSPSRLLMALKYIHIIQFVILFSSSFVRVLMSGRGRERDAD